MNDSNLLRVLYLGDVMGAPGMSVLEARLRDIRHGEQIDLVIAQSENVSDGRSMLPEDMERLRALGVDFFSGGNHTPERKQLHARLADSASPVIGPANMIACPGDGFKYVTTPKGDVLVVTILGTVFKEHPPAIENPLRAIDDILESQAHHSRVATIINIHADYSSEKRAFGYYLDGRVSVVVGDHWHVPTADAMILPKQTAYMTDVGMCGTLHSVLGVKKENIIARWRDGVRNRNELSEVQPLQLSGALVDIDTRTGLAVSIRHHFETVG